MRQWIQVSIAALLCFQAAAGWAAGSPLVVELFESQGCSSCPPSERTVDALAKEFGDSVIVLVFHVDYWDYLGWKDVFSDAHFTERQKMYGRAFAQDSIYTPEMVIQGEAGFNGSDLRYARKGIRARLESPRLSLAMNLTSQNNKVRLSVHLPPGFTQNAQSIEAIIYEDAAPVKVLRGENAGETMSGRFAVRDIRPIKIESGRGQVELTLKRGWNPQRLGVAVLVRGPGTSIVFAQAARWPRT